MGKIRTDHVTNSSSSSFILGFTNKEKIKEELLDVKDLEAYKQIITDCEEKNKMSYDEALELYQFEMENSWFEYFFLEKYMNEHNFKYFEKDDVECSQEYQKALAEAYNIKEKEFEEKCKDKKVFVSLHYSDEYPPYSTLENETYNIKSCMAAFSHH